MPKPQKPVVLRLSAYECDVVKRALRLLREATYALNDESDTPPLAPDIAGILVKVNEAVGS